MIGSLRGLVLEVLGVSEILIEVGGVGYRVAVPTTTLGGITVGTSVFLHVHTHVREDAIVLYGFADRQGRECFEGLISAHGVGPALALAILSVHSPAALSRAVLGGDSAALTLVPGVGPKTAARLLIDLEPRFSRMGMGTGEEASRPGPALEASGPLAEVRAALAGLGYGPDEIRSTLGALGPAGLGATSGSNGSVPHGSNGSVPHGSNGSAGLGATNGSSGSASDGSAGLGATNGSSGSASDGSNGSVPHGSNGSASDGWASGGTASVEELLRAALRELAAARRRVRA